ncbi:hypothetical protein ABIA35_004058 [Catenulispora sp. MAP12-49]|uniref:hypothetical protein n=1 Tax=Catenulispora sp. MAP12-49 TaxID=3156302 RepID=UPI003513DB13
MDWSRPHPYDPALSEAIGLVAYESAVLDDVLRQAIDELFYDDSYTWILLEGQSTEWLIDTTKTLLKYSDHGMQKFGAEGHEALMRLLDEARPLSALRNAVIHGVWSETSTLGEGAKPRYWGGPLDGAYFCLRSRVRRYDDERPFTIGDIERIATEYMTLSVRIVDLCLRLTEDPETGPRAFGNWRAARQYLAEQPTGPNSPYVGIHDRANGGC